jgi:hypothetical protein
LKIHLAKLAQICAIGYLFHLHLIFCITLHKEINIRRSVRFPEEEEEEHTKRSCARVSQSAGSRSRGVAAATQMQAAIPAGRKNKKQKQQSRLTSRAKRCGLLSFFSRMKKKKKALWNGVGEHPPRPHQQKLDPSIFQSIWTGGSRQEAAHPDLVKLSCRPGVSFRFAVVTR